MKTDIELLNDIKKARRTYRISLLALAFSLFSLALAAYNYFTLN